MKGSNYRRPNGMPLTHRDYAGGVPNLRIARFSTGSARKDYEVRLEMRSKEMAQIRDNAIEAARVAANKKMNPIGEDNYRLTVKQYPHVIISSVLQIHPVIPGALPAVPPAEPGSAHPHA